MVVLGITMYILSYHNLFQINNSWNNSNIPLKYRNFAPIEFHLLLLPLCKHCHAHYAYICYNPTIQCYDLLYKIFCFLKDFLEEKRKYIFIIFYIYPYSRHFSMLLVSLYSLNYCLVSFSTILKKCI